ncbi:MAG: hypothetical protein ACRCZ9_10345 [Fusobacteriaceae bacterium]
MTITGRTMLSTVEIEVYRDKNFWEISLIAYGDWIVERFSNPQECISYIEIDIKLSDEEKREIKDMEV